MSNTNYNSSALTQRRRDKAIAQQIFQANMAGQTIIPPQSSNASFSWAEARNGAITYSTQNGTATVVDPSCTCIGQTLPIMNTVNINNPEYIINIDVSPSQLEIEISINGSGTIYWDDGTIEPFNTNGILEGFRHIYGSDGPYTIRIATFITELVLSASFQGGGNPFLPDVTSLTLINPEGLTRLSVSCTNLVSITGLDKCVNLIRLAIGNNSCNIDGINNLSKLQDLELQNRPTLTSFDAISFPQLVSLILSGSQNLTTVTNLSSTITILYIDGTAISGIFDLIDLINLDFFACAVCPDITGLGTLPTSLTNLTISGSGISGLFDISTLIILDSFTCYDCPNITGLGTLPISLKYLYINGIGITGLFDISTLINLDFFTCMDCTGITDLTGVGTTLPTSLISLDISGSGVTGYGVVGEINVSLLTNLTSLNISNCTTIEAVDLPTSITSFYAIGSGLTICNSVTGGDFDASLLTELTNLDISACIGITNVNILGCTNLSYINVSGCGIDSGNADEIGTNLLNVITPGSCNISNQIPEISPPLVITDEPWSTLESNGWELILQ
jgi:hypothetical protein